MSNDLKLPVTILLLCFSAVLYGQNESLSRNISWLDNKVPGAVPLFRNYSLKTLVKGAEPVPFFVERIPAVSAGDKLELTDEVYAPLQGFEAFRQTLRNNTDITAKAQFNYHVSYGGNETFMIYTLFPFKVENGVVMKLVSYSVNHTRGTAQPARAVSKRAASPPSVLATGNWYKVSVAADGVYKMDANFLRQLGLNLSEVDPKTIKVYGHHGGMLPEYIKTPRFADLAENAIQVEGEGDGVFNDNDYVLFYAQSPHKWKFNTGSRQFYHETNVYSDVTYYFITYGGSNGKRIGTIGDGMALSTTYTVTDFDNKVLHETESENICRMGRVLLGEKFDQSTSQSFTENFTNIDVSKPLRLKTRVAAVSATTSNFACLYNSSSLGTMPVNAMFEYLCFQDNESTFSFTASSGTIPLTFIYNKPLSSSKGYLDYYELHATCALRYTGSQFAFAKGETYANMVSEFRLDAAPAGMQLWDVSDPVNVQLQQTSDQGGTAVFKRNTLNSLKQFIAFTTDFKIPNGEGAVENQDLHSMSNVDYIIIAPPQLSDQANRLADYHRNTTGLQVQVVTPSKIYNEFSSGSQDVTAIRDFVRTVYNNDPNPVKKLKYLLCFGDGSYDYKGKEPGIPNTNLVPVYEYAGEDVNALSAYCTDDYYGCLDSLDGNLYSGGVETMEVSVGRLPVANSQEASEVVDKIVSYHDRSSIGDWRNVITFIADDMDESWESMFVSDLESYGAYIETAYPNINIDKIYLDAYKEESTGGAQRYPDAVDAVKRRVSNGSLIINYVGHGGEEYLASEKVIDIPMINGFSNKDRLPLFFTATCEFSRYDDAKRKSAGEMLFTKGAAGAIAMLTTVRVVGASQNADLTEYFWKNCAFNKIGGKWPTIGDLYKKVKNRPFPSLNDLSFAMFGDPALTLAYPEYITIIDSVNGRSIISSTDTIKALQKVRITGHVEDLSANLMTGFNGELVPTVFDKTDSLKTQGNGSLMTKLPFTLRQNIIYKGKASVSAGKYAFEFVVPKDISYNYGKGKISLYADDGSVEDAAGNTTKVLVGGTSSDLVNDTKGPELEVFIDDYNFVNGGLTDQTPLFLAKVYDENGINTAGSGIGRELMAVLDKGTVNEKSFVLNNYYTAKLNSYQEGEIKYQMEGISEGKHTITLKVWDVYNNSAEASTEFIVANGDKISLNHVLNYPNPFSTNTNFHFDHNKAGQNLNVTLQVMSLTGRVVKTIQEDLFAAESHVQEIKWDARDDFGDKLSKGVYIYKIRVRASDGSAAEVIEKLVILN